MGLLSSSKVLDELNHGRGPRILPAAHLLPQPRGLSLDGEKKEFIPEGLRLVLVLWSCQKLAILTLGLGPSVVGMPSVRVLSNILSLVSLGASALPQHVHCWPTAFHPISQGRFKNWFPRAEL